MSLRVKGLEIKPEDASTSFLLIHGFCAAPDELATLSQFLESLGVASFAVQLAGHGTTPEDLKKTHWEDWYKSVLEGFDVVKSWNRTHLFVAGFSMGGALSILLTSEKTGIDGLVLLAPALKIDGIMPKFVPLLKHFMSDREVDIVAAQKQYEIKRTKYSREPVSAYHELFKLQKVARKKLDQIALPTLIIQGTKDKTINPKIANLVFDGIVSGEKELHFIEDAEHVIPCHWTRTKAYPLIQQFIETVISKS